MRVRPISVELDYVGVLQLREVLKDELNLLLLGLEVLPLGELDLVPNDLDALFGVHCEVSAVDPWHILLLDLRQIHFQKTEPRQMNSMMNMVHDRWERWSVTLGKVEGIVVYLIHIDR